MANATGTAPAVVRLRATSWSPPVTDRLFPGSSTTGYSDAVRVSLGVGIGSGGWGNSGVGVGGGSLTTGTADLFTGISRQARTRTSGWSRRTPGRELSGAAETDQVRP